LSATAVPFQCLSEFATAILIKGRIFVKVNIDTWLVSRVAKKALDQLMLKYFITFMPSFQGLKDKLYVKEKRYIAMSDMSSIKQTSLLKIQCMYLLIINALLRI
jgi:hypothetical protein